MVRRTRSPIAHGRPWRRNAFLAGCLVAGVIAAAVTIPRVVSQAGTTAVSTTYKTAVNLANGSTAASADAPGGEKTGTAKPGDVIKWTVSYANAADAPASVNVTDVLASAGAYVPGSLELPPSQSPSGTVSPRYSTDGGANWATGTPPATANGVGYSGTIVQRGTQQTSSTFQTPPAQALTMSSGDAYSAVIHNNLVYAIIHHSTGAILYCAQLDGAACPGWSGRNLATWSSVVGTEINKGTSWPGMTASTNGTWVDGDKLFWMAGPNDNSSAGLACLDLSTTTPTSCGYLPRTGKVNTNSTAVGAQFAGTGLPAADGKIYAAAINYNTSLNRPTVAIQCVTPQGVSCPGATLVWDPVTSPGGLVAATFGNYVYASVQLTTSSPWQTYCFDIRTKAACANASWPQNTSGAAQIAGSAFMPILDKTGNFTGICTVTNGNYTSSACWTPLGVPLSNNPYAGTQANYVGQGSPSGPWIIGTKIYLSNGNNVMCRDFGSYSGSGTVPSCAGFTNVPNTRNYTVRSAEELGKDCLVATGDAGEIRFFNAVTGGPCTTSLPQTVAVNPVAYYCGSGAQGFAGWDRLTLPGLAANAYANAIVTLRDQNGTIVPGFQELRLSSGGELDLSRIPTTVTALSADVTISGISDPTSVALGRIAIAWKGEPPQMCFRTTVPPIACDSPAPLVLSNTARAVSTSTAGSDSPAGNPTGAVRFTAAPEPAQCSLAIAKTSSQQTVHPGDTVTYEISVRNTGTQAYDRATFSDDLTDVLSEATYRGDHAATVGTASYAQPVLSWTGPLAAGASAKVTYSVTVDSPALGDHRLVNAVISPNIGSNCPQDSSDPACTVTVEVTSASVTWHKTDATSAKNILAGAEWTLTPVDQAGSPRGASIVVTDCAAASASECTGADTDPVGGVFTVGGLAPGSYALVETRAPVGFRVDPTPIPVTIEPTSTTVTLPDVENAQLPVPAIPFTGGLGTDALTFAGLGLLTAVAALAAWQVLIRRRRA